MEIFTIYEEKSFMKYIKLFDTHQDYVTFKDSANWIEPNVSYCVLEDELHYSPTVLDVVRVDLSRMNLGSKSVGDSAGNFTWDPYNVTVSELLMLDTLLSVNDDKTYGKPVYDISSKRVYTFEDPTVVPPSEVTIKTILDSRSLVLRETDNLLFGVDNNIRYYQPNTTEIERVYNEGIGPYGTYYSFDGIQLSPSLYFVCQNQVNLINLSTWYSEKYDVGGDGEYFSVTSILDYNNIQQLPISGEFVAGADYSGSYFPEDGKFPSFTMNTFYIALPRQITEGSTLNTITRGNRYRYTILNNVIDVQKLD
jgi:hypothetical protein